MYKIENAIIIPDFNKFISHVIDLFIKEFDPDELKSFSNKDIKRKFVGYCDEIYDLLLESNCADKILIRKNGSYKHVNRKTFLSKILKGSSIFEILSKLKVEGKNF